MGKSRFRRDGVYLYDGEIFYHTMCWRNERRNAGAMAIKAGALAIGRDMLHLAARAPSGHFDAMACLSALG